MPNRIRGPGVPSVSPTPGPAPARDTSPTAPVTPRDSFSNATTQPPAANNAEFVALVTAMQPKLHAPTSYEAHFGARSKHSRAHVEGKGHIDLPAGNGRGPSFTAEAGKPLTVTFDSERVLPSTEKAELVWRIAPNGAENVVPLSDGTRDANGRLVLKPAQLELPPDADGTLRLSLRTHSNGRANSSWDPSYDAVIAPKHGSTIIFGEDWQTKLDRPVRAGDSLKLAYDQDRIRSIFGGAMPEKITASISFNGQPPVEVGLQLGDGTMALPTIKVPPDATEMTLWFKGQSGANASWDSALGQNFKFPVSPTRDDLDPSWKAHLLRSTSFPNLKAESFAAIGPYSERYNCIAWTVGVRNEWVWPGTKISDFDALYGRHGYKPVDGLDFSNDPSVEKIVIYGHKPRSGVGEIEVTHGALQDAEGRWTSKIGTEPLIRHNRVEDLAGPGYGEPIRVYARPRQGVHS